MGNVRARNLPLCMVLIPFGKRTDDEESCIKFKALYDETVLPAIKAVGLEPYLPDVRKNGESGTRTRYEALVLCEYAVIDLTVVDADILFELGARHAARPFKTIVIHNESTLFPTELNMLKPVSYQLQNDGALTDKRRFASELMENLKQVMAETFLDSPLFQLFRDELKSQELISRKTEIFRDQVFYSPEIKKKLAIARKTNKEELKKLELEMGDIGNIESAVLIDLFLSYRATRAWDEMIALVERMPPPLAERIMVREQLAFALNRKGECERAEEILIHVLEQNGPSSETYSLLGRVYKDRWLRALKNGNTGEADAFLESAINTYIKGFETDCREAFPGINAVNLLELKDAPDPRKDELLPIVTYAVRQKVKNGKSDYWDYATLMELAVLANEQPEALTRLKEAKRLIREPWEPETTARTLRLIHNARVKRNQEADWIKELETELLKKN